MEKEYAIVVAGGSGTRMKSNMPKQFLEIGGFPVLMHTLKAFHSYSKLIELILVLPQIQINFWEELCNNYQFNIPHKVVVGGELRQDSVKNGLDAIESNNGYVAIHDGVRPFITNHLIAACFFEARKNGNAVASVALKDSIRFVSDKKNKAVDRQEFRIIQTPQTFLLSQVKQAYKDSKGIFTDDASLVEYAGNDIFLIEGSYENIKITTAEDLEYADAIIRRSKI